MTTTMQDISGLTSIVSDIGDQIQQIDYEPVMIESLDLIAEIERDAFNAGRSPGGELWAQDKPSTVKKKGQAVVLFESGTLEKSLIGIGAQGNIHETSHHGLLYGTEVPYAIFNQEGTSRAPARPNVGVTEAFADELAADIGDFVVDELKRGK